jgi:hypothetical protein
MKKHIGAVLSVLVFLLLSLPPVGSGQPGMEKRETRSSSVSDVVYGSTPDWESGSPAYSTGGALADFNNDGWLDLVVSDGNDMSPGHVRVYLNDGTGHLPTQASWQSADVAYNGHLDVADINGDGWVDVAVAYLGTGSAVGPIARVYMNNNGVLSSVAEWNSSITACAFGVDFGDMNNDGRPDLAIATGNDYIPIAYHTYVYLNVGGSYGSSPSWVSDDQHIDDGVLWVDADSDGWLDLAAIGSDHQTEIYRNLGGVLETTSSWQTTDSGSQFGIMLTSGDVTGDGIRDLFATDNIQLGGDGHFKQYTGLPGGFFSTTASWTYNEGYGAAVELADVNHDGLLDLATGAWWDNTRLFLNQGSGLPTTPSWSSSPSTVNEKIVFGNVGPTQNDRVSIEEFPGDGVRHLFYLSHQDFQHIDQVVCDGIFLSPSDYTYSREEGWLTVDSAPAQSLVVTYTFSSSLDMVVTNWDPSVGNYLYYNKLHFSDLETNGSLRWDNVAPGEVVQGSFTVRNNGEAQSTLNWSVNATPSWGSWTLNPSSGQNLMPEQGPVTVQVTVVAPSGGGPSYYGGITVVNQDDSSDFSIVPVSLILAHSSPVLQITSVKGPLGVSVSFKNTGNVSATHVNWSITVEGGIFHGINKEAHASILVVDPGQEKTVKMNPFFGFGRIQGAVVLDCAEGVETHVSFGGIQLLFFTNPYLIPCNMTSTM